MENIEQATLDLHSKNKGKIEIKSKVPIDSVNDLSLIYTPGVASVSAKIAENENLAYQYTIKGNTVAVVSDGSAVLGLGNIGAKAAIPVMEGKAALFKRFGNIDAFPICLDTQDPEEIIFTIKKIAPIFGGINLEDISAPRCFKILDRLKKELDIPVVHDDQQGTAVVVLAATINSLKIKKQNKEEVKIIINGAGAAGIYIAKLFLKYGFKNIALCDSTGPIYKGRENLNEEKKEIANFTNLIHQTDSDKTGCPGNDIKDCLRDADIFIGVSKGNLLTEEMIKIMNPEPIIFALANPTPEILPQIAKEAGARIIATGRSDFPNQINNVLVFPGIFRGALGNNIKQITDEMLIKAAENLAAHVINPSEDKIIPSVFDDGVMEAIAKAIK
jgi:malate dehydrogenase (oxaloacetate-decarboxylating)